MDDLAMLRTIQQAAMRTVRTRDLAALTTNTARALTRLVTRGAVVRLTHGIYTAPPDGADGHTWLPDLQTAAAAIATARFGPRRTALMGVSAARHWAAIPRAVGVAHVAVPTAGYAPLTLPDGSRIRFTPRDLAVLDLILEPTPLGRALVTTPAQTLYDILTHPALTDAVGETSTAADNLAAQTTPSQLARVIRQTGRANPSVRERLHWMETNDTPQG